MAEEEEEEEGELEVVDMLDSFELTWLRIPGLLERKSLLFSVVATATFSRPIACRWRRGVCLFVSSE